MKVGLLKKNRGFTIVEIIISSLIFSITAVGIFATLAAVRKPSAESQRRVTAAYFGKQVLDDLRSKIDATNWQAGSGGPLDPTITHPPYTSFIDGVSYTGTYTVETDPGGSLARKISLAVTWTEPN